MTMELRPPPLLLWGDVRNQSISNELNTQIKVIDRYTFSSPPPVCTE